MLKKIIMDLKDHISFKKEVDKDTKLVTYKVEVKKPLFEETKGIVLKRLSGDLSLKGFRKGKVPANVAEASLGPRLYEETLNQLLPNVAIFIIREEKEEPITKLDYNLGEFSETGDVNFEFSYVTLPEVKIPDFGKVKAKKEDTKVTKEEISKVIENIKAEQEREAAKNDSSKKEEGKEEGVKKEEKKGDFKPTDEWVAGLGMDNIKTVKELEDQITQTLTMQKEQAGNEKYQTDVLKEIVKLAKVEVPEKVINLDIEQRMEDYKKRITDVGLDFAEFMKNQKKTEEELRKEWKETSEEKIALDLILVALVRDEKITVSEEDVDKEIAGIQDEKVRNSYKSDAARNKVREVLVRQKAIKHIFDKVGGGK